MKIPMFVFSPELNDNHHNWPRNGDLVETVVLEESIPNTHIAVKPHRKTKYPFVRVAIVRKESLQKV